MLDRALKITIDAPAFIAVEEEVEKKGMILTESLVRTKLSTSMDRVAPSLGLSSVFFARAMVVEGGGGGG